MTLNGRIRDYGMNAHLVYPHQLFRETGSVGPGECVYLVEEPLLFTQLKFHKQKLVLHRASMKAYEEYLVSNGKSVRYVEHHELSDTGSIAAILKDDGIGAVAVVDPADDWLESRLASALSSEGISLSTADSPMFINTRADVAKYFGNKQSFFMADFYKRERTRLGLLMEPDGAPVGGKFSFDEENRKRLPKGICLPEMAPQTHDEFITEAIAYVNTHFPENYGNAEDFRYPVTHSAADEWLERFLKERLASFGDYEDAIAKGETFLFHSVLTPMLNAGLLTPADIIKKTLAFAKQNATPLNSLEGFIRQIIGWREFVRGVYITAGRKQRTSNFWGHHRKLPDSFWNASTGIPPLDDSISKVLRHAYCHHIERLMVIGNFMVLTEIQPDEAYRWFMEMYIDAYDWVMVPNVYGMSLNADGGAITTKPYISGSNYIRKMSDFPAGEWCDIWDGLYWRFIAEHESFFLANPRLSMMPRLLAKMDAAKRERLINTAENYLKSL
ncbi:MAG: cryptochrome/photolyase family protein [Pyrinomonadaceae bacterium]|nr:cryptochrome/photolyase family protein [Pyrinomonadaceae bacterium]